MMTKKYISFSEKISGTALVTSFAVHGTTTFNGGFWVGGLATMKSGNIDYFVAKFNDTGKVQFVKTLGLSTNEAGTPVMLKSTPSGGVVLAGQVYDATLTTNLATIVSINNDGTIKFYKTSPGNGASGATKFDIFRALDVSSTGDIIAGGMGNQYYSTNGLIYCKLDSNGNQIFLKNYVINPGTGNTSSSVYSVKATPFGYLFSGLYGTTQLPFLLFVDLNGAVSLLKLYTGTGVHTFTDVQIGPSGKIYVAGIYNRFGTNHCLFAAINPATLNIIWQKTLQTGGGGSNEAINKLYLEGKYLYATVFTNGFGGPSTRAGVMSIDTNGNYSATNVIYVAARNFTSITNGDDFDALPKGGMVIAGVDNGTTTPAAARFSVSITNPCDNTSCSGHNGTLSSNNLNMSNGVGTGTLQGNGSFVNKSATITDIPVNTLIECYQPCPLPKHVLLDTTLLCSGYASVSVDGTQALASSYKWDDGTTSPKKSFSTTGTYYLNSINGCGQIQDTLVVVSGNAPTSPSFRDTVFCTTGWSLYKNVKQVGCTYIWDNASTKSYRTFTVAGRYWVQTSNACGTRLDTIKIRQGAKVVMPSPIKDTAICPGETYYYTISPKPYHHYVWNDGDTNYLKGFMTAGTKILKASTTCESKYDTFVIVARKKPIKAPIKDTVYCAMPINYTLNAYQPGGVTYLWADGSTNPTVTVTYATKWWITTSNRCGSRSDTINIYKDTLPLKATNDNEYFCQGKPLIIKAWMSNSQYSTYQWSNGDKGPQTIIPYSTEVSLTITNKCGTRTDFVHVYSYRCDCEACIPNAFTPLNSDGRNDYWQVRFDCKYTDCQVKEGFYSIFDRWGNCVVHKRSLTEPWDGKDAQNNFVPNGIYTYIVHGVYDASVTGTRNFEYKGIVTVLSGSK